METLSILVVDDEPEMRAGIHRVLDGFTVNVSEVDTEVGFRVETAESGEEALDIIGNEGIHILLLDHKLPKMSGIDVLKSLSCDNTEMLVIMTTPYASIQTAIQATKLGAYDFLPKPFTPAELKSVVRKAAEHIVISIQAKRLAEEKKQVRFQFISVLAHELKSPINAVEGYLKLMEDPATVEDPATFGHMVGRSLTRISYMRKLIIDLLDMTRIESGKKQREFATVDVKDVAETAMDSVMPDARARSISVELETSGNTTIWADRNEIEIVLNNLVSNAVKYNRDGGKVYITLTGSEKDIIIAVKDTGIGMTGEETEKLFGDFVRIKNEKTRNILGSGLGLSIIKKITGLYQGSVTVESEPDVGSTFTAVLKKQVTDVS